jgi:hypothetical protein
MDANPHLVQMALRRQPWNAAERAAGGVVEQHPEAYTERRDKAGNVWLEHRLFWTTNPHLFRRSLCRMGWPNVPRSEGEWSHYLLRQGTWDGVAGDDVAFGYWGARDSGPWIEHVGHRRVGTGY